MMLINIHKIKNLETQEEYFKYLCKREGDNYWIEVSPKFCCECLDFPDCPVSGEEFQHYLESIPTCEDCGARIQSEGYLIITHQLKKSGLFAGSILCCKCYNKRNL